ncbi:MAG: FtsW/RodA/SpoVE family cell cycle protein [Candidatus Paceibacterota bacterium]|jgi:rod shape determining protein RodA
MSFFKKLDWKLGVSTAILIVSGLLSLFSTNRELFYKQIWWVALALVIGFLITLADLRSFFSRKGFILGLYWLVITLLVATYFLAPQIKGNRAWIILGGFQFQPAEIAKVALILLLAYFFSKKHVSISRWSSILSSFFYCAVPVVLIALQPDFGSALVLLAIWVGFVLVSGLPFKKILLGALVSLVVIVVMWSYVLQDYQKQRIVSLFSPEADPLGSNYNAIQSKIAIGSGGLFGKGFGQGTQVQLGFLPEAQTDFIFAAISEEGGIFAALIIFGSFFWMLLRILKLGMLNQENFYKFLSLGCVILFFFQFVIHVGSNLGILPVIGVTLPFVSYGGSSMLSSIILVSIIQSAYSKERYM